MMSKRPEKKAPPLKWLLTCSDSEVGNFELVKLGEVANLRSEMLTLFDRLVDTSAQAVLAAWLRTIDRNELRRQLLESPDTTIELVMSEAKAQIRNQGRSEEEAEDYGKMPSAWVVRPHMTPEEAKQAARASVRDYQERKIAAGKCEKCQEPLAHHSVRYCEKHLAMKREWNTRYRRKKGIPPGQGTQPGTLGSLAASRKKKAKALLAEKHGKP